MGIAGVVNPIFLAWVEDLTAACWWTWAVRVLCSYCLVMIVSLVERGRTFFFFFEGNMLTLAKNLAGEKILAKVLLGLEGLDIYLFGTESVDVDEM